MQTHCTKSQVYTPTLTNINICEQESPKPENPDPANLELENLEGLENLELENLELENLEQQLENIEVPTLEQEIPSLNLLDIVLALNYTYEVKEIHVKVPKCEILISWILMIFFYHEVSIGRGLEG